jgi:hypothetical protein
MTARILAVGILCAAALLTAPSADASQVKRPNPDTSATSSCTNQPETIRQLLDESRHATTLSERRLIHHELVDAIRYQDC